MSVVLKRDISFLMRPRVRENRLLKLVVFTEETGRDVFILSPEFLNSQHAYVKVRVIQTAFTYLSTVF